MCLLVKAIGFEGVEDALEMLDRELSATPALIACAVPASTASSKSLGDDVRAPVWFENSTVLTTSTSWPSSCRGKVADLLPT
jgi:hypothetical protein